MLPWTQDVQAASWTPSPSVKVKLIEKVAPDTVGRQLLQTWALSPSPWSSMAAGLGFRHR